jgi:Calcineurin-like phosphoesterase
MKMNGFRSSARCLLTAILLVVPLSVRSEPGLSAASPATSVIAVGDIHGDFDDFALILRRAELIDAQQHWVGGATTLVQVGDMLDRGPKEREVMDLLMSLEPEAHKAGGAVVTLLGNHEAMNIMGDLRYVTVAEYASFADSNSEHRRQSAYKQYVGWSKSHAKLLAQLPPGMLPEQAEPEWMARHPLGFIEQREAFGPNGHYGTWLRKHAVIAKLGGEIFLHGGIHPRFASMGVDAINARVRDEIQSFDTAKQALVESGLILPFFTLDEITTVLRGQVNLATQAGNQGDSRKLLETFLGMGGWLCVNSDGPLWFRGFAQWSDEEGNSEVGKLLEKYNATHFVVGHTPQSSGRITSRFGGRVLLIDTGMLHSYYPFGRPSALKIESDSKFIAEYTDSEEVLIPKPAPQASMPRGTKRKLAALWPNGPTRTITAAHGS